LDGTMCPSYMATLEEKHSTRGRANTLRLAMAGRLGDAGLGDHDVFDVLDLCLECRACKAECPVGVDVGRFKSEFLADYWQRTGVPLGVRAIGHINRLLGLASRFPGLSNAIASTAPARWTLESLAGIDRRRTLPRLAPRTFASLFEPPGPGSQPRRVVLFDDTFTNFCHPQIGLAANAVLSRAGFVPALERHVCCGRPLISKGLLPAARELARQNVEPLHRLAAAGVPIVFLEPSCLSAVREDAPDLLRGDEQRKAREVAAACVLFEDFLERQ